MTCVAWFQSWPLGCVTRIATLPWNAILALSVSIELVSSAARVSQLSLQQGLLVCLLQRTGPIDRTPGTPGSDKKKKDNIQLKYINFSYVLAKFKSSSEKMF